jgi:hypothetical protein
MYVVGRWRKKGRKKALAPASWLWIRSDGTREEAHAPTQDELKDLFRELMEWREAHPEAMPPQLGEKLDKFIQWPMRPFHQRPTPEQRDRVRWEYVCKGIARFGWEGGSSGLPTCSGGYPIMRLART